MKIGIDFYINMTYENSESMTEYGDEIITGYVETIKQYFLLFKQPPPEGLELWPETNEDAEVVKITRLVFYPDGSFLIDCSYDGYIGHDWFLNKRFEFELG